ncbi:right-handed parallel beta-helix repeat-containing protein [Halosquirtibacter laminarini]|uniref:Right-handed parallel beta-helix repeat-containing protein n=1 Tax=Halosquirtibacter laminarini TaxID=3374600 RepID=A0AC61NR46_9BACT|nr:right-handed parallel beta-helix repeat-containing protein [Prolixibacteraceae bacterium]
MIFLKFINKMKCLWLILSLFFSSASYAKNLYVSSKGNDKNRGTLSSPLLSIDKAVKNLQDGDTCFVSEGVYRTPFSLIGSKKNIVITSIPGQRALFDGTIPLSGRWVKVKENTYRMKVKKPVSQLFRNDKMLILARWPNASFEDGSFWDMMSTWRHQGSQSCFGTMYDSRPDQADYKESDDEGASTVSVKDGVNMESLADTKIDFTGAIAVMNIGSWLSWAQPVVKHKAGSSVFQYSKDFSRENKSLPNGPKSLRSSKFFKKKMKQGHYYLIGKMALDISNEWFYDTKERAIYVVVPNGKHPNDYQYKGKVHDYMITGSKTDNVTVSNIDFFGATFHFMDSKNISIDGCNFNYPSYHKFALGILGEPKVSAFDYSKKALRSNTSLITNNMVRNSTFAYADGPGLSITGRKDLVENCYFHDIDWSCLGSGASGSLDFIKADDFTFRYNTVHTGGNSEGVRVGNRSLIEYNHIYNLSLLQHDGSAINVGVAGINGSIIRYNWVHSMKKAGIRFDSSGYQTPLVNWGENGTVNYNVVWNTGSVKCKGNKHTVLNNTVFETLPGLFDIGVPRVLMMGSNNSHSVVKNNIAPHIGGHFALRTKYPCPGDTVNNWQGEITSLVRDAYNYDFRPTESLVSTIKKSGESMAGAYSLDDDKYWIPGYVGEVPNTSVPRNHATNVRKDLTLFWNKAKDVNSYIVYFGTNKKQLGRKDHLLTSTTHCNATPRGIDPSKRYYWRVDVKKNNGTIVKGNAWTFGSVRQIIHSEYKVLASPKFKYKEYLSLPKEVVALDLGMEKNKSLTKVYNTYWSEYENNKWLASTEKMLLDLSLPKNKLAQLKRFKKEVFKEASEYLVQNSTTILNKRELEKLSQSLHLHDW